MAKRSAKKSKTIRAPRGNDGARTSKVSVQNSAGGRNVRPAVHKSGKSISEGEPVRGVRTSLMSLRQEIDRVFDELSSSLPRLSFGRRLELEPFRRFQATLGVAAPAVDLVENEGQLEITAELPGMEGRDVEVLVSDGVLTIRGHKQEQREERKADVYLSERRYGSFQRSFQLPNDVDPERANATLRSGLLKITLPKVARTPKQQKKIVIRGN